jgi:diguanylate cyclase (GGDEF)-like protein
MQHHLHHILPPSVSHFFTRLRRAAASAIYPEYKDERNTAERLANTDALTGLANRRAFDLALPAAEADPEWAVVVADADHFKIINDTYGHQAGDYLLRRMAMMIKEAAAALGYGERVFRWGGDEFVALVPEVCARKLAAEIVIKGTELAALTGYDHDGFGITAAVGRTFKEADGFLIFQKQGGKGKAANA